MSKIKKYTEKELQDLGFERNYVSAEESGDGEYVYYTFDLDDENYTISLISGMFENDIKEVGIEFFEGSKYLSDRLIKTLIAEYNG